MTSRWRTAGWTLGVVKEYLPHVIFMDIGMPGMDGFELAARLWSEPALNDVVIAALTGCGQPADRNYTAAAGFNYHLVKPPEPEEMDRIIADLK